MNAGDGDLRGEVPGDVPGDPDAELDRAIAGYLEAREDRPGLLPGEFAAALAPALRSAFLRELEQLAELDEKASLAPPRDLPRRFGDFRVLGQLGQGAMGDVYLAEQVSLGRRVALKVLRAPVAGDLRSAARFQREARTAASLVHPCIVPILGFGEEQGCSWLAMGLVDGRSLQRLLAARDAPADVDHARSNELLGDPRWLATALADAADALDFAHRKNVVHRDVKPGNLMAGDDGKLVVLDFGLASARPGDESTESLTRTGDFLGTPLYMAPEQTAGADAATARSDVYALGAVLYECLCGAPPVAPGPLPAVLDAIRSRDPDDPARRRAGVPAELARVAMQCLEKDPARRYESAAALADDLRRFVDGQPVRARGLGPVRRIVRRVQRRPAVAVAVLLLIVAAVFGASALQDAAQKHIVEEKNAALGKERELREIRQLLALSPEGITVFGGASRRWYEHLGLGDHLPEPELAVTPAALEALRRADALAVAWPDDGGVQRARYLACVDVGVDDARVDSAFAALQRTDHDVRDSYADRIMRRAWQLHVGRPADDGELMLLGGDAQGHVPGGASTFWSGLAAQGEQRYVAAIGCFDGALQDQALSEELRYFAYLHRGWCKTCPEISRLRDAEDDLLAAATLRPNYGTARLLWAGLRCLDPNEDLARPVQAVTEVLTAVKMEPWVVVLTARVLLAIAEDSTAPAGPLRFAGELSPLASQPVSPERRRALAAMALGLLEKVIQAHPSQEASIHRIAALAILGRHADALAECNALAKGPLAELLRARVELAAGRAQLARDAIERALAADPAFVAAWRCRADLCAHVGDRPAELEALARAAELLVAMHPTSVLPDAQLALPELQMRRARLLIGLGRSDEAKALVSATENTSSSPRLRAEFADLGRWIDDGTPTPTAAEALFGNSQLPAPALAASARRGWSLPTCADLQRVAAVPGFAETAFALAPFAAPAERPAIAHWLEDNAAKAAQPLTWAPWVALSRDLFLQLLRSGGLTDDAISDARRFADASTSRGDLDLLHKFALAHDAEGDNSEARLLEGAVLLARGEPAAAAAFFARTRSRQPDDLRGDFLEACAALAADDADAAKRALHNGALRAADLAYLRARAGVTLSDVLLERLATLF